MAYKKVEVPVGSFVGWGKKRGQYVEGKVLDYDPQGGTDFAKKPCPLLEVELTKRAASFDQDNNRTDYDPGETVMLTCGQANLKKSIKAAARDGLKPGNLIRIELVSFEKVPNGTVKVFEIQVDRDHEDKTASSKSDDDDDQGDDDEPPF